MGSAPGVVPILRELLRGACSPMANAREAYELTKEDVAEAGPLPYDTDLIVKVQTLIDDALVRGAPPIQCWNTIIDELKARKIVYYVEEVAVLLMLTHPKNRGGLVLNPYNCHRIGLLLKRTGADLKELAKATAFELCPVQRIKAKQLAANEKVIRASGGLLADINGSERFHSIGTSHTAGFCKAVLAGAKSVNKELCDSHGRLNEGIVCGTDKVRQKMMQKGWGWDVLPWQCEVAWPKLPHLGQLAQNASNATSTAASEMGCAKVMSETRSAQLDMKQPYDPRRRQHRACAAE